MDYAFPFFYFLSDYNSVNYQPVLPVGLSFHQLPNGSLSIVSISKESEGAYTCTAQNGIRTSLTKTINISVNGRRIPPLLCTLSFIYRSLLPLFFNLKNNFVGNDTLHILYFSSFLFLFIKLLNCFDWWT